MPVLFPGKDPRGDAELVAAIRAEIDANRGAITFARFMTQALQHPARGYYRRGRTRAGHGGDFLTSPESHPAFGAALARQIEIFGEVLGEPGTWIEAGAGVGTLSNQVRASVENVVSVDTTAHAHSPEKGPAPLRVRADSLPFARITGGIFANELLDAFPVHRLKREGSEWRELCVANGPDGFTSVERDPEPAALAAIERAMKRGAKPQDGGIYEVAPAIAGWIADAARVIERGFLLLVDYGDDTPALFSRGSTLRSFLQHSLLDDPFQHVGNADMTASVDFGAVVEAARVAGFDAVAFLDQHAWLAAWGVPQAGAALPARAARGEMRVDEAEMNARGVAWLCDRQGLGKLKVLALAKGVKPALVPGLAGDVPEARRFTAETLPLTRLPDPFADLYE